ncbi:DUF1282 domain-containing protein [Heliorestis acidaminivorans]|uniref:DUF1282 domain-containing protein n=1 Tax=Heliorestis acidaminivorans TaxID=553427 RepID=A0A6I0F8L5_9FIRM|nr:Yip1 family protein [Heliorestis acidaminivorans]KAB2953828.1 DUF1282 domain-containing protein [Heliorestis acidaminivorans]
MDEKKPPTVDDPRKPEEENQSSSNPTPVGPEEPQLETPQFEAPKPEPKWTSWDYIYNVLAEPNKAFAIASREKPLGLAFAVIIISTIISLVVNLSMGPGDMASLEQQGVPVALAGAFATVFALISAFFGLVMWLLMAGIYNLIGELLGGKGNAKGLLVTLGLASLPTIFTSPLRLIAEILPGGNTLEWLGLLAISLWTVVLQVFAIKQSVQLSTTRSVLTFFAPFIFMLFIIITLVILIILTIPAIGSLPGLL